MISDTTIIINLTKTAWASYHARPDYAHFCLTEAQALMTQTTESFESMAAEELNRRELLTLEYPRDDVLITAAMARRSKKFKCLCEQRRPINHLWQSLARCWCWMRGDYDQARVCCRHAAVVINPEISDSTSLEVESLIMLQKIAGDQSRSFVIVHMNEAECGNTNSVHSCISMAMAWSFLMGTARVREAGRCLRKAESLANSVHNWIDCAHGWRELSSNNHYGDCLRCEAKAKSSASSTADWIDCCEFALEVTKDAKSIAYCLSHARQCPATQDQVEYLDELVKKSRSLKTN